MRRRALLVLTTVALVLAMASGTAVASPQNGSMYFNWNDLYSVDPSSSNAQTVRKSYYDLLIDTFDMSRDGRTIVYEQGCGFCQRATYGPLYTIRRDSHADTFEGTARVKVVVKNLWDCGSVPVTPDFDCTYDQQMTMPRFSPDGKTIYFIGQYVLGPDDKTRGLYSVPTAGGEATRIPIVNADGSPRVIGTFALSHDGTTFAVSGAGPSTVPVGGGLPRRVTRVECGGAQYPSFSPDDKTIVYARYTRKDDNCAGTGTPIQTLFTTPVGNDGTQPGTALFPEDIADPDTHGSKWFPTYSPDGKYIAFAHWRKDGPDSLAVAPATGGPINNIVSGCAFCEPIWFEKLPETAIDSGPSGTVGSASASFGFSSDQGDATFECKLDDGAYQACASPQTVPNNGVLSEGSHTFKVRAVDASGGADPTPASRTWTVDTTAPTISGVSPSDGAYDVAASTKVAATFAEAIDPGTVTADTFTLVKQGSSNPVRATVSYGASTNTATLDPGSDLDTNTMYTARVEGGSAGVKDLAGHPLAQDYTWTFTTAPDTTPPDTTILSGPSGYLKGTSASFSFSSSEGGSAFKCSLDGGAFSLCASPRDYSNLAQGSHTFRVRAFDEAGNPDASPASRTWFVDTGLPGGTISINGGNASTSKRSVTLRLSASDPSPASGVASMRFRNGGTSTWSGWSAYSTSKSWTLTAGAGTKTVFVQYKDNAGNVSASASDTIRFNP